MSVQTPSPLPPAPPERPLHTRPSFWVALAAGVLLVLGAVLTLVLVLVGGAVAVAARDTGGERAVASAPVTEPVVEPEDADVFSLRVGDCLTDVVPEGQVEEVPVVPCDQPHLTEAYFAHAIEAPDLPERAVVEALVDDVCVPAFGDYVGLPYEESALYVSYLSPTVESWRGGDRELLCLLEAPEGETLTGTARGTAR